MLRCLSHLQSLSLPMAGTHSWVLVKAGLTAPGVTCAPPPNAWEGRGEQDPGSSCKHNKGSACQAISQSPLLCCASPCRLVTTSHACCPGLLPTVSSLALCQHTNAHFSPLTMFDTYFIELFTLCSQRPAAHKTNHVLEAYAVIRQWL